VTTFAGVRSVVVLTTVLLLSEGVAARGQHQHHKPGPSSRGGKFDYYVLSLSWSPEHCAEKPGGPDDSQCGTGRHYGFVVHGLWPQYENGGYPQSCSTANHLADGVIQKTLDIMPSADLIRHEWQRHGTCSGLPADAYFEHARQAFQRVAIPDRYKDPETAFQVSAADVRKAFQTANAILPSDGLAVLCSGHFFTELRLCLAKDDLAARSRGGKVRDSCDGEVTVRPVR